MSHPSLPSAEVGYLSDLYFLETLLSVVFVKILYMLEFFHLPGITHQNGSKSWMPSSGHPSALKSQSYIILPVHESKKHLFEKQNYYSYLVTYRYLEVYFLFYHMDNFNCIQVILESIIRKHLSIFLTSSTCHLWKSLSSLYFYYKQLHQFFLHL